MKDISNDINQRSTLTNLLFHLSLFQSFSLLEILNSFAQDRDSENNGENYIPSILKSPYDEKNTSRNISWCANVKYRSKTGDGSGVFRPLRLSRKDLNRIIKRIKDQEKMIVSDDNLDEAPICCAPLPSFGSDDISLSVPTSLMKKRAESEILTSLLEEEERGGEEEKV